MTTLTDKILAKAKDQQASALGVKINGKDINQEEFVPKADTKTRPELSFSGGQGPFIGICLDLDPPYPSFHPLGPILHWLQAGLQPSVEGNMLESSGAVVAEWIAASPPPLSGPHRYVFALFEQPAGFDATKFAPADGKPFPITKRMRWSLPTFAKDAGLGDVVAAKTIMSN